VLFAVICYDKPNADALRIATRPAHLAFLEKHSAHVKLGGPVLDDAGERPIGSLLIIEQADKASAQALISEDPYAQAGLFERVEILGWKRVVGAAL